MRGAGTPLSCTCELKSTDGMDIVSIATTAFGLAKHCAQIALYISKISKVDKSIGTLCKEVRDLSSVLYSIHESLPKVGSFNITSRMGETHWRNVERSLGDCQETLTNLDNLVKGVKKTKMGIFRKPVQQIKLDWKSGDIALLQRQIVSCRTMMDLSLQMITVYIKFLILS